MATVYLAHDIRHGRRVAIKVLRPDLAAVIGAERFVREIRTIAALQHPHILGLIDSGEVSGTAYFVMPYVDGESLRDRLDRETQLPVPDAVRFATEVAAALDYAHRQGVIHRDIKPENILLHDGSALVADFGIALAVSTAGGGTRMTETGMSLGTPHYMSPEQAMGEREITARSDVYGLGAVLYEMLAGEPPFTGPTAQAIVARVVTEEPRPLGPRRRSIPPNVEAATMTALEKVPADRFESAGAFAAALRDESWRGRTGRGDREWVGSASRSPRTVRAVAMTGALLLGVAVTALAGSALRDEPAAPQVVRYGVTLPTGDVPVLAVPSPDGSRLALLPLPGERQHTVWIKERDEYLPERLEGAAGAFNIAWSPDGQWIAYTTDDQLYKIPASGGQSIMITDSVEDGPGLAWLDDGSIVFLGDGSRSLRRVSADGGPITTVVSDSGQLMWPAAVPGGRVMLYTRCPIACQAAQQLWALDLESGRSRQVLDATRGWYLPGGRLVFVRRDGLVHAAPFDLGRLDTTGAAVPVLERVLVANQMYPLLQVGASGTATYRTGAPLEFDGYELIWVDREGTATPVDAGWHFEFTAYGSNFGWALSPDERRIAVGANTPQGDDIWVKQLPDGPFSRVSYDSAADYRPTWTPDGRVMFASNRNSAPPDSVGGGLFVRRADGTGRDSMLYWSKTGVHEGQWSPDGRWLVFRTGGIVDRSGDRDIVAIRPGIDTAPQPLIATRYDEMAIAIAPNGRWIAYESDETGRPEVFIRPFPDVDAGKWQVSNAGGVAPLWSRDGRELFYVDPERRMTAVPFAQGPGGEPRLGGRRALFEIEESIYMTNREYYTPHDVASDGRFLMARRVTPPGEALEAAPLVVVENWHEELRRMER